MPRYGVAYSRLRINNLDTDGIATATSAAPMSRSSSGNVNSAYVTSSATSGDTRLTYQRLDFSSTGSGETLRAFTRVTGANAATGGTVNGAHISLSVNSGGTVSGAGNALRATLGAAAGVTPGGTCAVIQVDSDFAATSNPGSTAFLRFTDTNSVRLANLLNIPNASNGTVFAAHTTQTLTHSIRVISADGTPYYIMCTNAATNRS